MYSRAEKLVPGLLQKFSPNPGICLYSQDEAVRLWHDFVKKLLYFGSVEIKVDP